MIALTIEATIPVIITPPTVRIIILTANVASLPPGTPAAASDTMAEAAITPEQAVVVKPVLTAIVVAALVMLLNEYGSVSERGDKVLPMTSFEPVD